MSLDVSEFHRKVIQTYYYDGIQRQYYRNAANKANGKYAEMLVLYIGYPITRLIEKKDREYNVLENCKTFGDNKVMVYYENVPIVDKPLFDNIIESVIVLQNNSIAAD